MVHVAVVPRGLRRNFRLFYAVSFFSWAHFSLPIYMLFGVDYLGVSYLQAGALFLISWIVSLCFDFLTGTIADRYGRRRVFVIGLLLQIACLVPFVVTKNYSTLVVASVVAGIGMALVSNTLNALLYEQSKENDALKYFQRSNAAANAFSYGGRVMASVVGGFVYFIHPTLPYGLTILALVLALVAGARMHFSKRVEEHAEDETNPRIMASAWRVFASNSALIKFVIMIGLISVWGDYIFTSYQPYYIDQDVSSVILGYIYAGISVLSAVGSVAMRSMPSIFSAHFINSLALIGIILTASVLLLFEIPAAYLAPVGLGIVSGFSMPNLNLYVNRHAPAKIRSSVLSIATTAMGIGSALGILFVLLLINHVNFHSIMLICIGGCVVVLAANIFFRPAEKTTL